MPGERIPPDRLADDLARIYGIAARRLQVTIAANLRSGAVGSAAFRERQLRVVQLTLDELRRAGPPLARRAVEGAYASSVRATDGVLGVQGAFGGAVHRQAIDLLVQNLVQPLGAAVDTVGRRVDDVYRRFGLEEAAIGLAQGAKRTEISTALRDRLIREGVTDALTGFVDRSGKRWNLSTYTEMVARTVTREACTTATVNRLTEHGEDLISISSHRHPADVCTPYDGKTFSISGTSSRYRHLDQRPPFHPRCKHVAHPAAASFEEFERQLGLAPTTPPATATPPPPARGGRARAQREADVAAIRTRVEQARGDVARGLDAEAVVGIGAMLERTARRHGKARKIEAAGRRTTREREALRQRVSDRAVAQGAQRDQFTGLVDHWHDYMTDRERTRYLRLNSRELELHNKLEDARREDVLALLREVRPGFGEGKLPEKADTPVQQALLDRAVTFLPREWVDAIAPRFFVTTAPESADLPGRSFYRSSDNGIRFADGRDTSTMLHELGHAAEHRYRPDAIPALTVAEFQWYRQRTEGGQLERLRDVTGSSSYRDDEVTIRDDFADPYIGKWYGTVTPTGAGDYNPGAFEVLSMGLEGTFFQRHGIADRDVEHLRFTLGALAAL